MNIPANFDVGDVVEHTAHPEWLSATVTAVDVVYTINGGQSDEDTFLERGTASEYRLVRHGRRSCPHPCHRKRPSKRHREWAFCPVCGTEL